jgi:3-hydroxyisobutyrate dehydrogenase
MGSSIGYVGAGLMGGPMVKWLLGHGFAVRVFDIATQRLQEAAAAGAHPATSPAGVLAGAELVALNLPSTHAVEEVVFGAEGIAQAIRPPCVLVDFSTIEVESCRGFAQRLKEISGCNWIDAPVSGGPIAAGGGTLAVMAGGDAGDIARLRGFFDTIAGSFTHVGPTGDGLVAKMVGQLIVGCLHVVLAEAARLAELSGIDAALIPACVAGGHPDGVLLRQLYPRIVARDFQPRAYARQLLKDLRMVEAAATGAGMQAPMLAEARRMYAALVDRGDGELDTSAVVRLYEVGAAARAGDGGTG